MAVRLTRETRFSLTADVPADDEITNSWGGWPSVDTLAPYLQLRCTVAGEPEQPAGYACNVKSIDEAVRQFAIPAAARIYRERGDSVLPGNLLEIMWEQLAPRMPEVAPLVSLELLATPMLRYELQKDTLNMIRVTQQFEFSAAHRLHVEELSTEENRDLFGKCNNENGHGHNYRLDVTVAQANEQAGPPLTLVNLERIVKRQVIDRFDHKHLNEDTEEFRTLNPTVENIASVTWSLLADQVTPATLEAVRVYETPKTWAECRSDS